MVRDSPKDSSKRLELDAMVPPKIDRDDSVCHGQIEALATTFESSDHYSKFRVRSTKALHGFVPSLWGHVSQILRVMSTHLSVPGTGDLTRTYGHSSASHILAMILALWSVSCGNKWIVVRGWSHQMKLRKNDNLVVRCLFLPFQHLLFQRDCLC